MRFWNGNKSEIRQRYELSVLRACLEVSDYNGELIEDRTILVSAEEEGAIFENGFDLTGTVLGNPKFKDKKKSILEQPLAKGLLGKRVMIIREEDQAEFTRIKSEAEMKLKISGIPETWADADLFRANGYTVLEKGSLEDIFKRLAEGECDYVALGAIEVEEVFSQLAEKVGGLCVEQELLLQYPMPLVFYISPLRPELIKTLSEGLDAIALSGRLDELFEETFGETIERLSLEKRRRFFLENPTL